MFRYNHFAPEKFQRIKFSEIGIGEKFRMNKWNGKIRRNYIVMIKTGDLTYEELVNKKSYTLLNSDIEVFHYSITSKQ